MLTAEALAVLRSTYGAKFESTLAAKTDAAYRAFVTTDTFGSEGYTPFMLGGVGQGQQWLTTRVLRPIAEYGITFQGKRYENSTKIPKTLLADSPAIKAARVASEMAVSAIEHPELEVFKVLSTNPNGFDGDPLFGTTHKYSDAEDAPVYSNDITGSGAAWYLVNQYSVLEATRTGEDYTSQFLGGEGTDIDFNEDACAFGWRARKIFAPGFFAHTTRSKEALDGASLQKAIALRAAIKGDTGQRLNNLATHLVVPRSLEAAATKLIKAMLINGGDTNTDYNRLTLIVSDLL